MDERRGMTKQSRRLFLGTLTAGLVLAGLALPGLAQPVRADCLSVKGITINLDGSGSCASSSLSNPGAALAVAGGSAGGNALAVAQGSDADASTSGGCAVAAAGGETVTVDPSASCSVVTSAAVSGDGSSLVSGQPLQQAVANAACGGPAVLVNTGSVSVSVGNSAPASCP